MTTYAKIHDAVRAAFLAEVKPEDLARPELHAGAAGRVATRAASVLGFDGWKSDTPDISGELAGWMSASDGKLAVTTAGNPLGRARDPAPARRATPARVLGKCDGRRLDA